jgi:Golgi phosphoprotein 3
MTTITRRIVKPTSSNTSGTYSESASNNTPFQSNQDDRDYRDKDDERDNDDDDDKETRLTLLEEVLLLGLKDREVC